MLAAMDPASKIRLFDAMAAICLSAAFGGIPGVLVLLATKSITAGVLIGLPSGALIYAAILRSEDRRRADAAERARTWLRESDKADREKRHAELREMGVDPEMFRLRH